ncbi:hypothetical protein COM45_04985 [Corynebacterium accolens]|uniref:Uncharacterized protein n=1 Tax=Corynebacterium accolens TaxID=38284 RepID=A0A2A4AL71_9CORY|nr:hypothetical protein COM45_04985 [Corynebacterium accolens]
MALKKIGPVVQSIGGAGWDAHKTGNIVTLILNAPVETVTLPTGYRPRTNINMSVSGVGSASGRAIINANSGAVTPFIDGNVYGTVTYPT